MDVRDLLKANKINPFYNLEYHILKRFKYPFYIHSIVDILDIMDEKGIPYNIDKLIAYMLNVEKHILPYLWKLNLYLVDVKAIDIINNRYLILNAKYEEGNMDVYMKEYLDNNIPLNKEDSLIEVDLDKLVKEFDINNDEIELFKFISELIVLGVGIDDKTLNIVSKTLNKDISDIEDMSKKVNPKQLLEYVIKRVNINLDKDIKDYTIIPRTWINNSLWVLLHKE